MPNVYKIVESESFFESIELIRDMTENATLECAKYDGNREFCFLQKDCVYQDHLDDCIPGQRTYFQNRFPLDGILIEGRKNVTDRSIESPDVPYWTDIAALPDFRKLYGIVNKSLKKNETYNLIIYDAFPISTHSSKGVVMVGSQEGLAYLGNANPRLVAYLYLFSGIVSFLVGLILLIKSFVAPRPFGRRHRCLENVCIKTNVGNKLVKRRKSGSLNDVLVGKEKLVNADHGATLFQKKDFRSISKYIKEVDLPPIKSTRKHSIKSSAKGSKKKQNYQTSKAIF